MREAPSLASREMAGLWLRRNERSSGGSFHASLCTLMTAVVPVQLGSPYTIYTGPEKSKGRVPMNRQFFVLSLETGVQTFISDPTATTTVDHNFMATVSWNIKSLRRAYFTPLVTTCLCALSPCAGISTLSSFGSISIKQYLCPKKRVAPPESSSLLRYICNVTL